MAWRLLLERYPAEAAELKRNWKSFSIPKIETDGGKLPAPLLRWIDDDLAFTISTLEELGFRLDRYRYLLLPGAKFTEDDVPLDREAQLIGILGNAVDLIEGAHGILHFYRPESQFERLLRHAMDFEPVDGLQPEEPEPGVVCMRRSRPLVPLTEDQPEPADRIIPRISKINGAVSAEMLHWIEQDSLQTAGMVAEFLWPLFPTREILEANGAYDGEGNPLDREAQLAGFVDCAIEFLEDAFELLNGRRPLTMAERVAEAELE